MTLSDKLYVILIKNGSWKTILDGLWMTIRISALALLLGTLLGAIICLLRIARPVYQSIIIGMLIYLTVSYIVFGLFALSDKIRQRKRSKSA